MEVLHLVHGLVVYCMYLSVVDGWPVGKLFVDQVNEIHILLFAIKVNNYLNEENL